MAALAGLVAAPALIERIMVVPRVWRVRKVMGEVAISGEVLRKLQAEEGAFVRHAQAMLNEISAHRLEELHRMYGP